MVRYSASSAAREGAIKARTQAVNQLKDLIIAGPEELRARLRPLSSASQPVNWLSTV
jgi:hypothetical protein